MNAPKLGSAGRTLTALAPSGRVEVGGVAFQAETSLFGSDPRRPPIPSGQAVVVSGWRLDGEHGVVLVVADPTAPPESQSADPAAGTPAPPADAPVPSYHAARQEERIRNLERQLAERREPNAAGKTVLLGAGIGLAAGLLFSWLTYRGPGLVINPLAFALWTGGGALVGVVFHLTRGSGSGNG
jgi:hypothetical protein